MARRAVLVIAAVGVLAGCNDAVGVATRGGDPPARPPVTFGPVPSPVTSGPEAELTRCELVDDGASENVVVEIIVTNTQARARRPVAVEYTVTAGDGRVFDEVVLPHGPDLGAGRARRYREEISARTPLAGSTCELGAVDWEGAADGLTGTAIGADAVELLGCTGDFLAVTNRFDEPMAVAVTVEYFDIDGFSLGRWPEEFAPKIVDDRSQGGSGRRSEGGTIAPGERYVFPSTKTDWMDETPVACEVVDARARLDPEPEEVIVVG